MSKKITASVVAYDFNASKSYMQQLQNQETGISIYDHLTDIIANLLEQRPEDPLKMFEMFSSYAHSKQLVPPQKNSPYNYREHHRNKFKRPASLKLDRVGYAQTFSDLIHPAPKPKKKIMNEDGELVDEEEEEQEQEVSEPKELGSIPDLLEEVNFFEMGGAGGVLTHEEVYRLMVSMKKQLLEKLPLISLRLFGKITALRNPYYICEGEYNPEERPADESDNDNNNQAEEEEENGGDVAEAGGDNNNNNGAAEDDLPLGNLQKNKKKNKKQQQHKIPMEKNVGANKYSYWVCTVAGGEWIPLPNVKPEHIIQARKIKKFFTGDLNAPVDCHPAFDGLERDYLRAQIARIAAATVVAPRGVFKAEPVEGEEDAEEPVVEDEGDSDDEDEAPITRDPYTVAVPELTKLEEGESEGGGDADGEDTQKKDEDLPKNPDDYLKLKSWVHIRPTLLHSQGRVLLWKPEKSEDDDEEEEDDDDDEKEDEDEKENAEREGADAEGKKQEEKILPILASLDLEDPLGSWNHNIVYPGWRAEKCFNRVRHTTSTCTIVLRSLRWPGAYNFVQAATATGKALKFGHIYVGYGHKYTLDQTYTPTPPASCMKEYPASVLANAVSYGRGASAVVVVRKLQEMDDPSPEDMARFKEPEKPVVAEEQEEEPASANKGGDDDDEAANNEEGEQ